jgi:hypothetical protein
MSKNREQEQDEREREKEKAEHGYVGTVALSDAMVREDFLQEATFKLTGEGCACVVCSRGTERSQV